MEKGIRIPMTHLNFHVLYGEIINHTNLTVWIPPYLYKRIVAHVETCMKNKQMFFTATSRLTINFIGRWLKLLTGRRCPWIVKGTVPPQRSLVTLSEWQYRIRHRDDRPKSSKYRKLLTY